MLSEFVAGLLVIGVLMLPSLWLMSHYPVRITAASVIAMQSNDFCCSCRRRSSASAFGDAFALTTAHSPLQAE